MSCLKTKHLDFANLAVGIYENVAFIPCTLRFLVYKEAPCLQDTLKLLKNKISVDSMGKGIKQISC